MPASIPLLEALVLIPDPRDPRGRIHPLVAVLSLTVVGLLAGCRSWEAIAQFGRDRGLPLAAALGFRRGKTPNKSALGKIFRRLDVVAVERAMRVWLESRKATTGHVALDGKTLTGSRRGEIPGRHLVSAFATEHAAVIGQLEMARSTNEHKAALRLLGVLPLAGRVVTADAMFTHRDIADTITGAGGDYVLAVKDNQELLKNDVAAEFAETPANFSPLSPATAA